MGILKQEIIGGCRLILGDCLKVMPLIDPIDHIISDPPYEAFMHKAKGAASRRLRTDGREETKGLNFSPIDEIREQYVALSQSICCGWFINFCTPEGVGKWADCINNSSIKYKRACTWVKPDSTPQLNGQGPAMGAENFVCAWSGDGFSKWNAGGKRGVYTHLTNARDRHGAHPTEKPWRLMAEIIQDFTKVKSHVLDPFMGSGTTLVACVKTDRISTGIERDPEYFQIACERVHKAYSQPDMFMVDRSKKSQQGVFL